MAASEQNVLSNQGTDTITHGVYSVSWTTGAASAEATYADALGQFLAQTVRTREPLHVRVEANGQDCPSSIGDADICIYVQSHPEQALVSHLAVVGVPKTHIIALDLAWDDARARLTRLLKAYVVERCQRDTFASWVGALPIGVVRARLGLPESPVGVARTAASFV